MIPLTSHSRVPLWTRAVLAGCALALTFALGFAEDAKPNPQARFDAIVARMEKVQTEFMEKLRAEEDQTKQRDMYMNRPGLEFAQEFKALALETKGTEVAAKSWMQVAEISGEFDQGDDFEAAIDTLVAEHIESEALSSLPAMIGGMSYVLDENRVQGLLEKLLAKSPHKPVQAGSIFELAQIAMRSEAPEKKAQAKPLFDRLVKDYGDIKSAYGKAYKTIAAGFIFELENLQIGQTPPDFEAVDENGVKFRLSDYRGKVVVLDFWGFW